MQKSLLNIDLRNIYLMRSSAWLYSWVHLNSSCAWPSFQFKIFPRLYTISERMHRRNELRLNFASMCEIWNSNCCKISRSLQFFLTNREKSKKMCFLLLFCCFGFHCKSKSLTVWILCRTTTIHAHIHYHPSLSKARSCCGHRERRPERSQEFLSKFSTRRNFRTTFTSTWWTGRHRTFSLLASAVACICGVPVQVK